MIVYAVVFLVSAAALALQTALTRVFALAHWYHFAFMSVSVGLLGYGAAGSLLHLFNGRRSKTSIRPPGESLAWHGFLFSAATVVSYLVSNSLPLDTYLLAIEPVQWGWLLSYFAVLTLPFLFAGMVTALALSNLPAKAGRVYAASMGGSAAGAALALILLSALPPGEVVLSIAWVVAIAVSIFAALLRMAVAVPGLMLSLAIGWLLICFPGTAEIRISPYKAISQALLYPGARVIWTGYNAFSRVDLLESQGIRLAAGLSMAFQGALPIQRALCVDGENLTPVVSPQPESNQFVRYLPSALPYRLLAAGGRGERSRQRAYSAPVGEQPRRGEAPTAPSKPGGPSVLVLEPGGGLEVIAALEHGASRVVAVAQNPAMIDGIRQAGSSFLSDPRVQLEQEGIRAFMARSDQLFDLVVVPLVDSFRVVTVGGFSMSENYLLTVESAMEQYRQVANGGFLMVNRWLQLPPSEELRALLILVEALARLGVERPFDRIVAIRTFQTATILVKQGELQSHEIAEVKAFTEEMKYDLIWAPGLRPEEANRYNVLPRDPYYESFALTREKRSDLLASHPFDVSPTTDDRPFFFNFFRLSHLPIVIQRLGSSWQPFGGSGYLVMLALLGFAIAASVLLILGPLWIVSRRAISRPHLRWTTLVYFLALGAGYLFVEIALIQRMVLFLDQPTYSFAAVLFALLLFSGVGSLLAGQLRWPTETVLAALVACGLLLLAALPRVISLFLGQPLPIRLLVTLVALAPLGVVMGMPFPRGIALLGGRDDASIPWAFAINGCASVVGAILASMVALSWGFNLVLLLGCVLYATCIPAALRLGGAIISPPPRSSGRTPRP